MRLYDCIFASVAVVAVFVFFTFLSAHVSEKQAYEAYIEATTIARESPMPIGQWRESPKESAIQ